MAQLARVYLKNQPRLKAKLIALKNQTAKALEPALISAAEKVVTLAKQLCPVQYGDLRDSIGWSFGAAPKGSIALASGAAGNKRITIFAGNKKAYYARWVEFGTKSHVIGGQRPGTVHPGSVAEPFFFPAWRTYRKGIKRDLGKAIRGAVKNIARAA